MERILDLVKKYKIQILVIIIILLFIPIVSITINKIKQNYKVETVSKEKYFVLLKNNMTGVIDGNGDIIIEPQYYNICIPNPSKAIFVCYYDYSEDGGYKTKVVNAQGTELFTRYNNIDVIELNGMENNMPYEKNLLKYSIDEKIGLIDLEGNVVLNPKYEEIQGLSCKEGELLVKKDEKYGVINNKGVELIKAKYDYIAGDEYYTSKVGYKLSGYIIGQKTENGYRYGYMNYKRKILLNTEYNEVTRLGYIEGEDTTNNIFIIARKNGRSGLVKNKKTIIDFKYQDINYSGVKNLFITTKNTKSGVCTTNGKKIIENKYEDVSINKYYIEVVNDGKEEYFDLAGKKITKKEVENIEETEEENDNNNKMIGSNIIPDKKDGKWGFINKNFKVVVDYKYDEVTEINKYGFAGIKKDGKWGSIDNKGNIIQEPIYNLDDLEEISFIGKYYKIAYDYKTIYYTDEVSNQK